MSNLAKVLVASAAVVAVAVVGINLVPGRPSGAGAVAPSASPSASSVAPSASPSPTPEPTASLVAHTIRPCCLEDVQGLGSMTFAITAPSSWDVWEGLGVWPRGPGNGPPDGAYVGLYPGGDVYSEPCLTDAEASADVLVGPTVDDLVTALVDHPALDVTAPVDVTLAGYSGRYLDLTVPDDISECAAYMPMNHHIYAQGPGQRWHMWILDVDGVRLLVETNDYAGTPAERLAEEQAIVESLVITP
ncbi:MAG TPA: hypothetical protein VF119_10425 [Candidatus Limnocylindrales bacterium]